MGSLRSLECPPPPATLAVPQGAGVYFTLPYALGSEVNLQRGVVLTRTGYNATSTQVGICPIVSAEESIGSAWSIPIGNGDIHLRPDLLTFVARKNLRPILNQRTGELCMAAPDNVQKAIDHFIEIITPTPQKIKQASVNGFLKYGQMAWFKAIPRPQEPDVADQVPALCLMPPSEFRKSSLALIARCYTNISNYNPRCDIAAVPAAYGPGMISTTNLQTLDPRRLRYDGINPRSTMDDRALRGFISKIKGHFSDAERKRVAGRYTGDIGELPAFIISDINRYHGRRAGGKHFG